MHQHRLVVALVCAAALLTLAVAPAVLAETTPFASARPSPSPSSTLSPSPAATSALVMAVNRRAVLSHRERRRHRIERRRALVLRVARRQLGVPYVWGGASPQGFDCSGLTMYLFQRVGVNLAHAATDQARSGQPVSLHRLKPADLVFYGAAGSYYHVAVYVGHGRVIDAPRSGYRVRVRALRAAATARRYIGI